MALIPLALLWLAHAFVLVSGFNFSVSQVGQCDPFTLSWSDGYPPFQLLIIPPGGVMNNVSIPVSAYNSSTKKGSYTLPRLDLAEEQLFMLSISDSTGMFAGGTSSLMTVGAPRSGQSCNTTFPRPDFTFSLDSDLAQCSPLVITLYRGSVEPALPIRLLVNEPEGQSFVVSLSPGLSQWTANLTAGTPAALTILDALGRNGGTATLRVAQPTNDTSCIITSSTTSTGSDSDAQQQKIIGLAVGISVGGFGVLCIALSFFFWYRRKLQNDAMRPTKFLATGPSDVHSRVTPAQSPITPSKARFMQETIRRESPSESSRHRLHPSESSIRPIQSQGSTSVAATRTTASYPSDIVIHTDISELTSGPVEFPPEYSPDFPPLSSRFTT